LIFATGALVAPSDLLPGRHSDRNALRGWAFARFPQFLGLFWSVSTWRIVVDFPEFQLLIETDSRKIDRNRVLFRILAQKVDQNAPILFLQLRGCRWERAGS
jgi:hypothetical protein